MSVVRFNAKLFAELIDSSDQYSSRSAFADAAGVSRQYISNLIAGGAHGTQAVPALDRLIQFAQLLGLDDYQSLLIIPKELAQIAGIAGVAE